MMPFGLATLSHGNAAPFAALVVDDRAVPLATLGIAGDLLSVLDRWDELLPVMGTAANDAALRPLADFRIHAPYTPRQVFCTGANYKKHVLGLMADESMRNPEHRDLSDAERTARLEQQLDARAAEGTPYCFVKLPSCTIGPCDDVVLPGNVEKPDWELELGVVIGRRARHVTPETAMDHVAGFAIVNDVTARDLVFRRGGGAIGADWLSGKCFPTFLPFGPLIVPRAFVADPYALNIRLSVNGRVFQDETTADMMVTIEKQIAYLSDRVVLLPGDVICTGSPYGNGSAFGVWLQPGDVMEGTITGLGTQRNSCIAEA